MAYSKYPKIKQSTPTLNGDQIQINSSLSITLQRTIRIPQDGKIYPLPPSLGSFPVKRIEDYADKVPQAWKEHGGVFFPMYQREAMWINFRATEPTALKVAVGKINAVTGEEWTEHLEKDGYVVTPKQPWLDGIKSDQGQIKQFVAMPLGMGYTVEGQVTGVEEFGGIQLKAYAAKEGAIPKPVINRSRKAAFSSPSLSKMAAPVAMNSLAESSNFYEAGAEMGMAAGGQMEQQIFRDPYGQDVWDQENTSRVYIHIVNSQMYKQITGEDAPSSPIDVATYNQYNYPWFAFYDENAAEVAPAKKLDGIKSVHQLDKEKSINPSSKDGEIHPIDDVAIKKIKDKFSEKQKTDWSWTNVKNRPPYCPNPYSPPFSQPLMPFYEYPNLYEYYNWLKQNQYKQTKPLTIREQTNSSKNIKDGQW